MLTKIKVLVPKKLKVLFFGITPKLIIIIEEKWRISFTIDKKKKKKKTNQFGEITNIKVHHIHVCDLIIIEISQGTDRKLVVGCDKNSNMLF